MGLDLFKEKGTPLEKQRFTWKDLVTRPISKLNDDAYSRMRVLLLSSVENESLLFSHACARTEPDLLLPLSKIRRIEQHQSSLLRGLIGVDHSPLEVSIAFEQTAVEMNSTFSQLEKNNYMAQSYRYALVEDMDHLYRFCALLDRLEGKDANNILQNYTDIAPGRPTMYEHQDPSDDLRRHYNKSETHFLSKMHALSLLSIKQQMHSYYLNTLALYSDPSARQLLCEINSVEEQHLTQFETIIDPQESLIEKWLLHEVHEVYTYYSCVMAETDHFLKGIWERFLDYELGHLQKAIEFFQSIDGRDANEVLPATLEEYRFSNQRSYIRSILNEELDYRSVSKDFIHSSDRESSATVQYREYMNAEGSPSEIVAAGYVYRPGTENAISMLKQ